QLAAIVAAFYGDAAGEAQVRVARPAWRERAMRHAEVASFVADGHAIQADEGWDVGIGIAAQARHYGPERWVMGNAVGVFTVAGHNQAVGVLVDGYDGADRGKLVPHAGLPRKMLGNLHADHVGLDGPKFAAIFHRGFRLEIVHVHVGRSARQVNHDGGFV